LKQKGRETKKTRERVVAQTLVVRHIEKHAVNIFKTNYKIMIKYNHLFYTRIYLSIVLSILSLNAISQKFKLPDIPKYDSIYIDSYNGVISQKSYFLSGNKVFEIGYKVGSILNAAFTSGEEDSCYAYFNGKNHDSYDFYYISKPYIRNEKYSETSKIFEYHKFNWNYIPIEQGDYYFIKKMYESTSTIYYNKKYKIGIWIKYDSIGKPIETIDYDNFTINNKPIKYTGKLKIIDSLKVLSDKKLIEVYGRNFYSKYIRFNLDHSGYYPFNDVMSTEQPGGNSILEKTEKNIYFVDLSYDIVIGDERFNSIQFRVTNNGQFLGRTYFPNCNEHYLYLTQGLDSLNNGKLHKNVLNWKKIATNKGLDITNKYFVAKFDFKPTSDYYGELRLVLEQTVISTSKNPPYTNVLQQFFINPWTGEIIEKIEKKDEGRDEMEVQRDVMEPMKAK